jgi:hypothetical protein
MAKRKQPNPTEIVTAAEKLYEDALALAEECRSWSDSSLEPEKAAAAQRFLVLATREASNAAAQLFGLMRRAKDDGP